MSEEITITPNRYMRKVHTHMRIMNGSIPETEWNTPFRGPIRSEYTLTRCTLGSYRTLEQNFSLCFEGRSVHNAHLFLMHSE